MKIRLGLVSNSSSASYTITLKYSMYEFYEFLLAECDWPLLQIDSLITNYEEDIISIDKSINRYEREGASDPFYKVSLTNMLSRKIHTEQRIQALKDLKEQGKWNLSIEELEQALQYHGIKVEEGINNSVIVSGGTSMHNNYIDGVPNLLQEIILVLTFENPSAIFKCTVNKD